MPVPNSALTGLTDAEVQERLARGQRNVFAHKSARSAWDIIRDNVFTVFNIILFVTLSATLGIGLSTPGTQSIVVGDIIFSGGTVWLNMIVGIIQEMRAKRTLDKLAALSVRNARVRRNGQSVEVPADQIVLDDLVELTPGDRVPVDGEVVASHGMEIDESLLTGESDSISKQAGDQTLSGSFCLVGTGIIRASGIGAESYANKLTTTARAVKDARTPLQRKIDFVVQFLVIVMAVITALQVVAAANNGISAVNALRQTLVIVTSFVPAGLILAITVSLSVGAVRISQYGTLVQRINAIESMGNVTVLCADKTGTLTRNLLTVQEVIALGGHTQEQARALLAQFVAGLNAQNKTAGAIGSYVGAPQPKWQVTAEVPFSSARKWSALTLVDDSSVAYTLVLGSPEILFGLEQPDILTHTGEFTRQGLRVVALMSTSQPLRDDPQFSIQDLTSTAPVALVVIRDEIRADIRDTLRDFARLGVRIKVISGDNAETVQAIARQSGLLGDAVVTEFELAELSPAEFDRAVAKAELFARINPETKQRIVSTLTQQGEYVAMVGDGVNDVPAIKQARLGIAMNDGAQITKDVSALVLLENTMSTLPRALQEGRAITQKIYASAKLYLAKNVITILAILFAGFVGLPFPGEPRQISWIATMTVGLPCTLLAFGVLTPAYTRRFLSNVLGYSVLVGAIGSVVVVIAYIVASLMTNDPSQARTVFALVNLHYAIHVFWDTHDVSVFSIIGMRKHPRETLVGLALLAVGLLVPVLLPGIFNATPPDALQWGMILVLPVIGSYALRNFTYGSFMRKMVKTLRS